MCFFGGVNIWMCVCINIIYLQTSTDAPTPHAIQNNQQRQSARALTVLERALRDVPSSVPLRLVHLALLQVIYI